MSKKILSLIVAAIMLCTSISLNVIVFAADQPNYNIYEGYQSLKIHCVNTDGFSFYTQGVAVQQNTDYTLSIWSKGGASPSVRVLTGNWSTNLANQSLKGGTIWQQTTATFNTGSETAVIFALTNNPYGGNGDMFVDNASLSKVSDGINVLNNPGFESGATNWGAFNTMFSAEASPIYIHPGDEQIVWEENIIDQPSGNSALNLYAGHNSLQYTASSTPQSVKQEIVVAKNTTYKASFWTRSPDSIKIDFNAKDSSSNSLLTGGLPYTVSSTPSWVRTEVQFTTVNDTKATFELSSKSGQTGSMFIDYCMVVPKMKPQGMGMVNLIQNTGFEDNTVWSGIQDSFSIYENANGTIGDISGGVRVMPIGDSITAGVGSTLGTAGYKRELYEKYGAYGANVNFVGPSTLDSGSGFPAGSGHAGFSGWRIDQIDEQINGWMKGYEPQVILMMIGSNDILQDTTTNNLAAAAPAKLEALVDKILIANPQIELYLAAVTPLDNDTNDAKVQIYNTQVQRIATSKGANVHLVDMYNTVLKSDLTDRVHPKDSGYTKMAQKWFDSTKDTVKNMIPHEFVSDQGTAYDGSVSLRYNPYYVPWYTLLSYEMYARGNIVVEKNTNYTLTMMIKGEQNISVQTRLQGTWSGDVFAQNTTMPGPKWAKNVLSFNSGDRSSFIFTILNNCMSTGNMYIDCIELYKEGSTVNLMTNSSMELKTNDIVNDWPGISSLFTYVEDTSVDPFHKNISITKDGTKITKLEQGQLNISADIASLNPKGVLIAALYQGQMLKNCVTSEEGTNLSVSIPVAAVDNDTMLKIFVFDSMDNIRDLMLPMIITQQQIK